MRKTFDSLITDICGKDKYSEQFYSSDDIYELLLLVRKQTLIEVTKLEKVLYYDGYQEEKVMGIGRNDVNKLPKDSIEL